MDTAAGFTSRQIREQAAPYVSCLSKRTAMMAWTEAVSCGCLRVCDDFHASIRLVVDQILQRTLIDFK